MLSIRPLTAAHLEEAGAVVRAASVHSTWTTSSFGW